MASLIQIWPLGGLLEVDAGYGRGFYAAGWYLGNTSHNISKLCRSFLSEASLAMERSLWVSSADIALHP